MIDYPNLIPECNVDTVFVEVLGYKDPNHASGISEVCKIMDQNLTKQSAMGFIDDDSKKPNYFKAFKVFDQTNKVSLFKHSERPHYLVVVKPAMDKFIYDLCAELEIDLSNYKLPNDFKAFKSVTKNLAIQSNPKFKTLLNTIIVKNPADIVRIKSWIKKYSPYKD